MVLEWGANGRPELWEEQGQAGLAALLSQITGRITIFFPSRSSEMVFGGKSFKIRVPMAEQALLLLPPLSLLLCLP